MNWEKISEAHSSRPDSVDIESVPVWVWPRRVSKGVHKMNEKIITESIIDGDLIFDGRLVFENNCEVMGNINCSQFVMVGNDLIVHGDVRVESQLYSKGNIKVGGDMHVLDRILIFGDLIVNEDLFANGYIHIKGKLKVVGDIQVGLGLKVKGGTK